MTMFEIVFKVNWHPWNFFSKLSLTLIREEVTHERLYTFDTCTGWSQVSTLSATAIKVVSKWLPDSLLRWGFQSILYDHNTGISSRGKMWNYTLHFLHHVTGNPSNQVTVTGTQPSIKYLFPKTDGVAMAVQQSP